MGPFRLESTVPRLITVVRAVRVAITDPGLMQTPAPILAQPLTLQGGAVLTGLGGLVTPILTISKISITHPSIPQALAPILAQPVARPGTVIRSAAHLITPITALSLVITQEAPPYTLLTIITLHLPVLTVYSQAVEREEGEEHSSHPHGHWGAVAAGRVSWVLYMLFFHTLERSPEFVLIDSKLRFKIK